MVKPNNIAISKRGVALPNSFKLMVASPSPLPVLDTINLSRLKTIRDHAIAIGIDTYNS